MIERFAVVLQEFHVGKRHTVKLFTENYSWLYLPASVHEICIHATQITNSGILPTGQLSEEDRNKDMKRLRKHSKRELLPKQTNWTIY
jgi:hypothetical protein